MGAGSPLLPVTRLPSALPRSGAVIHPPSGSGRPWYYHKDQCEWVEGSVVAPRFPGVGAPLRWTVGVPAHATPQARRRRARPHW